MKKLFNIIGILLIITIISFIIARVINKAPSDSLPQNYQIKLILDDDGGCLMCHKTEVKLPWYSKVPVLGTMIRNSVADGTKNIDLGNTISALKDGGDIGIVPLAKIEKAITDATMPPFDFRLIHWKSKITPAKKEIILQWIKNYRADYYYNGLSHDEFSNEPVQTIHRFIPVDERKVILGELLFNDVRLSADNTISCNTCHSPQTGGVDNKVFSKGVEGKLGGVNAPTVFNAVYNFAQFWDGRASTLAEQASGPPLNPIEMASKSFDDIINKLKEDKNFTKAFLQVYPEMTEKTITNAIQEFEKTLITPNSRFDRYLKGDLDAITDIEKSGYDLFKKYNCATCHTGTILGGQSYEYMGLAKNYFADRGTEILLEDEGRFKQTFLPSDIHKFKVPGLRNIALTMPYYHDGSQKTLEEAVSNMIKYQLGKSVTQKEIKDIVAFLNTLTGEYQGKLLTNKNIK
ncbi:MAG: cytochrome c peroxidase [Bacteroidales bacterium]